MDEESKRKVVEGLTILTKDILDKLNIAILGKRLDGFDGTIHCIKSAKRIFDVVEVGIGERYFSSDNFLELNKKYSGLVKNAEEVFAECKEGYERDENRRKLMSALK